MSIEYLVVNTFPDLGPQSKVRSKKMAKTWDSLQEALDELGLEGWDLQTCIYGPTGERDMQGDHFCEAFIFRRS